MTSKLEENSSNQTGTAPGSKHCDYCRKNNHNEKECYLKKRHEAERNRGRGHLRGGSRGGRYQSHFVESSIVVPQKLPLIICLGLLILTSLILVDESSIMRHSPSQPFDESRLP